jgi:hypothetical protein
VKKLLIAVVLAVTTSLVAPSVSSAGLFGRKEPKGAHEKNARQSTKNKHQEANARRAREQAAAARRQAEAQKAAVRRQQAAKQAAKANKQKQKQQRGRR